MKLALKQAHEDALATKLKTQYISKISHELRTPVSVFFFISKSYFNQVEWNYWNGDMDATEGKR